MGCRCEVFTSSNLIECVDDKIIEFRAIASDKSIATGETFTLSSNIDS